MNLPLERAFETYRELRRVARLDEREKEVARHWREMMEEYAQQQSVIELSEADKRSRKFLDSLIPRQR